MPDSEAKADTHAANPQPRAGMKLAIIAAGIVLAAASAGGAWSWMHHDANANPAARRKPLFSALETFTVNLQEARGDRFAQIGVTLEYEDPELENRIKDRLPALRNNILMLLSSKHVDDLLTPEGKLQLAREIQDRSAQALGFEPAAAASGAKGAASNPVRAVLFSQFIVQ